MTDLVDSQAIRHMKSESVGHQPVLDTLHCRLRTSPAPCTQSQTSSRLKLVISDTVR